MRKFKRMIARANTPDIVTVAVLTFPQATDTLKDIKVDGVSNV